MKNKLLQYLRLAATVVLLLVLFGSQQIAAFSSNDFACANQGDNGGTCFYEKGCSTGSASNATTTPDASVTPGPVYIMGDSITTLARSTYESKFTAAGWSPTVNGLVSRTISTTPPSPDGLQQIVQDKDKIANAHAIVIALGSNGSYQSASDIKSQVQDAMTEIKKYNTSSAPVYWINILDTRTDADSTKTNNAIKDGVGSDATVIDWYSEAKNKADLGSWAGGVHPTKQSDIDLLVNLVFNAVTTNGSAAATPSNPSTPTTAPGGGGGGSGTTIDDSAAQQAAKTASTGTTKVGYSLYDSNGNKLASYNGSSENYGASITKAMILVAYLKQVGSGSLSASDKSTLTDMIENSANGPGTTMYNKLANSAASIKSVASDAGMIGFKLDTSDPNYILGQSQITADDFARFFSKINTIIPSAQKDFGLGLLSHLASDDQTGLLQANLPGTVYSKEGWKSEPDITNPFGQEGVPYVVNQAAQFSSNGTTDRAPGEDIVKNVVSALNQSIGSSGSGQGSGGCCPSGGGGGVDVSGSISPQAGNGMSASAQQKFQQYAVAAGQKFNVDPDFIATFYYTERGRTGDSSGNNADAAQPPPVTGDGKWIEPAPPYGNGPPNKTSYAGYQDPYGLGDGTGGSFNDKAAYGADGNGDGKIDITDLADAIFTAANLLKHDGATVGASQSTLKSAATSYNTAQYALSVMNTYNYLKGKGSASVSGSTTGSGSCSSASSANQGTIEAAVQAAQQLSDCKLPYVWGGLHQAGSLAVTDCSQLKSKYAGADCSGSTAWVLHQAGMFPGTAGIFSGDFGSWGQAGQGSTMTVWENVNHVFIEFNVPGLGHYEMNTVNDIGGPRFLKWGDAGSMTSTAGFTPRHWPGT